MEWSKSLLSICLVLLRLFIEITAQYSSDNCDWTIWNSGDEREGVKTVTADCSEGHIDWSSPSGAVRINLQAYSRAAAFEACFIAKTYFSTVKISLEDEETDTLQELVRLDNSSHAMMREVCFESYLKPVVIYVEAQVGDWQARTIGHFDLDYDIRRIFPKVKNIQVDEMEECRPCSDDEILQHICTSDFVVRGSIEAVFHDDDTQESEMLLRVSKIHVQRDRIFKRTDTNVNSIEEDADTGELSVQQTPGEHGGTVIVPRKCGIQRGNGAFLFMGRTRLKRAFLKCAPRLEDFQILWKRAKKVGRSPCSLG